MNNMINICTTCSSKRKCQVWRTTVTSCTAYSKTIDIVEADASMTRSRQLIKEGKHEEANTELLTLIKRLKEIEE